MPTVMQTYGRLLKEYRELMENRNYSARYIHEAQKSIRKHLATLEQNGALETPKNLPRNCLVIIRDSIPIGRNGGQRHRQQQVNTFRAFANWCGARLEPLAFPEEIPHRPRITLDTWVAAREAAYQAGDIQGATLLLYLGLTARRGAALKALPGDIMETDVLLRDKGRGGGKQRRIPIMPDQYAEFQQFLAWRQNRIMEVLAENPRARIPTTLFITAQKRTMSDMKKTTMDTMIRAQGRRVGVYLTAHMVRRMAARELYLACKATGQPVETAMQITGHRDKETFMVYVGAIEDQKTTLMEHVQQTRREAENRKRLLST